MNVLVRNIGKHLLLFWVPTYLVSLLIAFTLIINFGTGSLHYGLAAIGLLSIVFICVAVSFWSYEKLAGLVQETELPDRRKIATKMALYFLPWLLFLFTLGLPSLVMTRFN